MTPIPRPPLRWFGGKWSLAPWIIERLPPHHAYVEPFAGALGVLLSKAPAPIEVASDLYGDVVEFFRVLRDRPGDLIRAIKRTPYAAAEVALANGPRSGCEVEQARRFFVLAWQTIGGPADIYATGWRVSLGRTSHSVSDWSRVHRSLPQVASRLRRVALEASPAARILERYDSPDTLFYVDPPYLASARRNGRARYRFEMKEATEHQALLDQLLSLKGMVALSGYHSSLYDAALADWERHETASQSHNGSRTEVLWLNPAAVAARQLAAGQMQLQLHEETV